MLISTAVSKIKHIIFSTVGWADNFYLSYYVSVYMGSHTNTDTYQFLQTDALIFILLLYWRYKTRGRERVIKLEDILCHSLLKCYISNIVLFSLSFKCRYLMSPSPYNNVYRQTHWRAISLNDLSANSHNRSNKAHRVL